MKRADEQVDDYLASEHFLLAEAGKAHAEPVLRQFASALEGADQQDVDLLERTLLSLDLPAAARADVPAIVEGYLAYLESSGKDPQTGTWSAALPAITERYRQRLRDDGSVRGATVQRTLGKVGRNDPCPCGSGRKYKKCCHGLFS